VSLERERERERERGNKGKEARGRFTLRVNRCEGTKGEADGAMVVVAGGGGGRFDEVEALYLACACFLSPAGLSLAQTGRRVPSHISLNHCKCTRRDSQMQTDRFTNVEISHAPLRRD